MTRTAGRVRDCGIGIGIWMALAGAGMAAPVLLGPGDVVSVSVLGRPDLGGEFPLRPDGTISMHVLGETVAAGLSESELEASLETALAEQTQLPASVTVSVSSWRPVYLLGSVTSPGAFAFRPGLTAQQAVALAGGPLQGSVSGVAGVDMRVVDQAAQARQIELRLHELAMQRARLEAEAAGQESLAIGSDDPALAPIATEQEQLFARRRQVMQDRVETAAEIKRLAGGEAESLAGQQTLLREQITEQEARVADLQRLFDKGLGNIDRLREAQRDLTADRIELMTAATFEARARQDVANADASLTDFFAERQREIAAELAGIGEQERATHQELDGAHRFLDEFGPRVGLLADDAGAPLVYRVTRTGPDGPQEIVIAPSDPLQPGDLVEVVREAAQPGG